MADDLQYPAPGRGKPIQQYLAEVEPLVAAAGSNACDDRVFLGRVAELVPSRTPSAQHFTTADEQWLAALETVAHRHGFSYELLGHAGGQDTLWLIPRH